jgi:hypothetical protein
VCELQPEGRGGGVAPTIFFEYTPWVSDNLLLRTVTTQVHAVGGCHRQNGVTVQHSVALFGGFILNSVGKEALMATPRSANGV